MSHFAVSSHGTLTLLEPLTSVARTFLASCGFRPSKIAVTFRDLRELRYAARAFGIAI